MAIDLRASWFTTTDESADAPSDVDSSSMASKCTERLALDESGSLKLGREVDASSPESEPT